MKNGGAAPAKRWWSGFGHALEGFLWAVRTEKHMQFHVAAAAAAVALGLYAGLTGGEWLWIALAIAFVWSAELINTAVERAVDLYGPEHTPLGKAAKDTAAAAALVASAFALVVALAVLLPALVDRLRT